MARPPAAAGFFAGSWTPKATRLARRDNADRQALVIRWLAWAWPLNRRILYNRASADPQGNPWDPKRQILKWDGAKWSGMDIPDYSAAAPGSNVGPFIMQPEGMGRLFAIDKMAEGPFPEHYEPFETPLGTNPLHPNVISNPAARIFKGDAEALGKADKFPYVGTTYRLTEHFHYWTKHALLNAIAQPEQFVEIGEKLANKLGISHGDTVKVSSNRGYIKAKAVVTKRIRTLKANGKDIDTIGIPIHWGYEGVAKKGFIANTLTPFVGDANTQTPEFKSIPRERRKRCNGDDLWLINRKTSFRRSATNGFTPAPQARDHQEEVAKLIDVTTCIGCKACQVACSEWNGHP